MAGTGGSMSLLDDVREVAEISPVRGDGCRMCDGLVSPGSERHAECCPFGLLPRIVAAMEAATMMSRIVARETYHHDEDVRQKVNNAGTYSCCPSCDTAWPCNWSKAVAANEALAAALRGEA